MSIQLQVHGEQAVLAYVQIAIWKQGNCGECAALGKGRGLTRPNTVRLPRAMGCSSSSSHCHSSHRLAVSNNLDVGVLFVSFSSRSFIGRREEGVLSSVKQHHFTQQSTEPVVSNCFLLPPSLLSSPAGSTPRCTRRPSSPTSAHTAPRPSPTPPTWLSTSVSTQGPSPTTVPTARRPSASSPTSSSTHGKGEGRATDPAPLACPPHPRPGHIQPPACGGRE